jgi:hypothetical protein
MGRRIAAMMMLLGLVLTGAVPGGAADATACELDAELCTETDADASCVAAGIFASGSPSTKSAYARTILKDPTIGLERDHQNPHQVLAAFTTRAIPGPPAPLNVARADISVHAGGIETQCHSYTNAAITTTKSCGDAKVNELIVDIESTVAPKIRIKAENLFISSCVAAEPSPLPPITTMHAERIVIESGTGTYTLPTVTPQPGPVVPIGFPDSYVAFNERSEDISPSGCSMGGGSVMRIVNGNQQIVIGVTVGNV